MTKFSCNDCPGKPCVIEAPEGAPDVCPFSDDEGGAHTCNWATIKDRRKSVGKAS